MPHREDLDLEYIDGPYACQHQAFGTARQKGHCGAVELDAITSNLAAYLQEAKTYQRSSDYVNRLSVVTLGTSTFCQIRPSAFPVSRTYTLHVDVSYVDGSPSL